jgi:hypothetical protein
MAIDPELRIHRDWINTIQPLGLVVSPPALVAAGAVPDRNIVPEQQRLQALVPVDDPKARTRAAPLVPSFLDFAREVLGWDMSFVAGAGGALAVPQDLSSTLPEFDETLRPSLAVQNLDRSPEAPAWQLLVQVLAPRTSFDEPSTEEARRWHASPQVRLERLLRDTGVPAGLLFNGEALRLVYAPRGESSGHMTWPVYAICEVPGRPLLSALVMLLGSFRLFNAPRNQSLLQVLRESRKYQNVVSTKLAGQVLEALNELLRGFQAANDASRGRLLDETVRDDPGHVYGGLLAVLLRFVFVLYAEERALMSGDPVYVGHYSLTGLFEKLRVDAGRFPDTMDQRYGAWSRLCVLFRLIFDGARHGALELPSRRGHLFDPDAWPFLEGRGRVGARQVGSRLEVPRVSDGVVYRVLEKLLILDGDRLSYRALDVEQIGSVYENMMGFTLERATEVSIGVGKDHVVVGLETLLGAKGADRAKHLKETADVEISGRTADALKGANSIDDIVAALGKRISVLTPRPVAAGGLYLQPTDERRRSGSHYTPRELTEPIVRTTLRPILEDLGPTPKPEEILDLKVCDPAMGSGAFLVETCRQLAEQLLRSWDVHGKPADIPPDEDPVLVAQRHVAQRCLYGVDKNPLAVDLGKLSLWLATLARAHSFSFIDHAIRHGDSLVGLSREQIASFHWEASNQLSTIRTFIEPAIHRAEELRVRIQGLSASDDDASKRKLLREADEALGDVRLIGDCIIACFFSSDKNTERKKALKDWQDRVVAWLGGRGGKSEIIAFVTETLREGPHPIPCFHWEIEFPEVFHAGAAATLPPRSAPS